MSREQEQNDGVTGRRLIFIFAALLLAMFVSSLSETIAATALPTIVGDLGGVEIMQWVTTTYIMASTITMPLYGRLGDTAGRKKLLVFALVVYTVGKVVCAISPNMMVLLAGRLISGFGGGGLIILSQAAIADVVPARKRGVYLGIMGSVFTISNVIGPLLGGWLVQTLGWRWIFWFTVPLATLALVVLVVFFQDPRGSHKISNFDWRGASCMSVAVIALVLAVSWGGNQFAWLSWQILGLFALAVVFAFFFVLVERKAKEAIIPMSLFHNRNFVLCSVAGMLVFIALMGTMTYLPTYFQIADKMSPELAGMVMAPGSIGVFITSTGTGWLAGKTGKYKWMPLAMSVVCAVGFLLMANIKVGEPIALSMLYLFVMGFGMGLGSQILVLVVQNEFPQSMVGTATAANNFFKQIGSTVGASLVGTLFTARLTADLAGKLPAVDNITLATITPQEVAKLPAALQATIATGYSDALMPLFVCFVPLMIVTFVLMIFLIEHPLSKSVK
jgi:EmrB/QacA subfamily drug resistance transporter